MIYVETSYYGVSFLYQYTLYPGGACAQPRVSVHSRGAYAQPRAPEHYFVVHFGTPGYRK